MELTAEQIEGLGIALNESALLGVEVDPVEAVVGVTFSVLTLPESGQAPEDTRALFILRGVSRLAASLRHGICTDPDAEAEPFPVERLFEVVRSFHGAAIYGWEFIDQGPEPFKEWAGRLSLDWQSGRGPGMHTIDLFQEHPTENRCLDLRIWFDALEILGPDRSQILLDEFIRGGKRWWDGLFAGDPRTRDSGIIPGGIE